MFALEPPASSGGGWTEYTLFNLWSNQALGTNPNAGVIWVGGSLYGTTYYNGEEGGCGSVYELSPPATPGSAWTGTAIHTFGGGDGCASMAPVTVAPGGVLYGTTYTGGSGTVCEAGLAGGCGTVFQLTPPTSAGGAWTETVIYSFTGINGDGAYPLTGVVLGKNRVLYGTTPYGGSGTAGSPC